MTFYAKGNLIEFAKREKIVEEMDKEEKVIKLVDGTLEWDEDCNMFRFNSEKMSMIWWINLISGCGEDSKEIDQINEFLEIADQKELDQLAKYYKEPDIEENECNICRNKRDCLFIGSMTHEAIGIYFCQNCINDAFYSHLQD